MVKYLDAHLLDRVFGALADPTRRRILDLLAHTDSRVTDIAKPFPLSLPAVSKHLRVLENAGLIERHRDGRVHRLSLKAEPMRDAAAWIERYREYWDEQFVSLSRYLEKQQQKNKDKP